MADERAPRFDKNVPGAFYTTGHCLSCGAPEDEAPDFTPEVLDDWIAEKIEQFEDDWPAVEYLLDEFRKLTGLVLLDVHPGNVRFASRSDS